MPVSFGRTRPLMVGLILACAPVLIVSARYLTTSSYANGKKTPAEPVETTPRPTPVSRKGTDRGIGGTGLNDDRGIGGTGFVGPITKFGSIYVNGAEIFYDPNREVMVDGKAEPASAMKIGYVARIIASGSKGDGFKATQIAIDHEVLGPISATAADKTEVTVLGQTVDIGSIDGIETLKVGDWIAVSGLRRTDEAIAATLIETIAPTTAQIVGRITRSADGRPMIGAMPLVGPIAPEFFDERVTVRGQAPRGSFRVRHIAEADLLAKRSHIGRISIEGFFRKIDKKIVLPADPEVQLTGKPGSDLIDADGQDAALRDGNSASIVDGNVEPNGAISITNIRAPDTRFESRGGPDMAPRGAASGDPNNAQSSGKANQSRTGESEDGSRTGTSPGSGGESEDGTTSGTGTGTSTGTGTGAGTSTVTSTGTSTSTGGTNSDSESSGSNASGQSHGGTNGSGAGHGSGSGSGLGSGHGKDN